MMFAPDAPLAGPYASDITTALLQSLEIMDSFGSAYLWSMEEYGALHNKKREIDQAESHAKCIYLIHIPLKKKMCMHFFVCATFIGYVCIFCM